MGKLDLRDCVVRVQSKDGHRTGGTGFIVAPNLIVTCAHVVRGLECQPGDQISLSFSNNTHKVLVTAEEEGWDEDRDVAFLRPNSSLPADTRPAVLGPSNLSRRHQLESFGYPAIGDFEGIWIGGEIRGVIRDEPGRFWLQLNAGVKPGFSGAPVLDVDSQRVVGMISLAYQPGDELEQFEHTAFAITSETIASLRSESLSITLDDSRKAFSHLRIEGDGNVYGDQNQVWIDKSTHHYYLSPSIDCSEQINEFLEHYLERNYFGGRQQELDRLDNWLNQSTERNAVLAAPAGLGKSALAARWVNQLRQTGDVDVVYHPISLRFGTHQIETVLQSLVSQLSTIYNEQSLHVSGVGPLQSRLTELLKDGAWPHLRRPVLVVVDGLDEMNAAPGQSIGFPPQPSSGIHVLVTARSAKSCREDDKTYWQAKLNWKRTPFAYFELTPLSQDDVRDIVEQTNLEHAYVEPLAEKLHSLAEGYPLLIDLYLLRLTSDEGLTVDSFLEAEIEPGLGPYIEEAKEALRFADLQDSGAVEGSSFLGLLSAAYGPLSIDDLQGIGIQTSPITLREIVGRSRGLVIGDGKRQGFALSHPMIKYVYEEIAPDEVARWKKQLVAYCERAFNQLMDRQLESDCVPHYVLEYYAEHLLGSQGENADELLFALICEEWMQAHLQSLGGHKGFLRDIDLVWKRAREIGEQRVGRTQSREVEMTDVLDAQFRCAISRASIVSIASNLPPLLPALLVREGIGGWQISQARSYANSIPDPIQRSETNLCLLEVERLGLRDAQRSQIASEILNDLILGEMADESTRCRLLLRLLTVQASLNSYQVELARDIALGFSDPMWRARGLAQLMSCVDHEEIQFGILTETIQACLEIDKFSSTDSFHQSPYLYAAIARNLPIHLLDRAIAEVLSGSEVQTRRKYWFFSELAWHISAEQAEQFIEMVYANLSLTAAAVILSRLSPRLDNYTALELAEELAQRYKAADPWNRSFWYRRWEGCTPAFLILAHHCTDPSCRRRLLDIAQESMASFGEKEHPITHRDSQILYGIVEGSCSDHKAAELVFRERFLEGFFTDQSFGLFSEELVDCLGTETLKAVLDPVTRKPDSGEFYWDTFIGKSGYFLPRVASKLSDREWPLIYSIGSGRNEYAALGYIRATAQHITREGTPKEVRKEIAEWVIKGHYFPSGPDATEEMLQAVAPFVPPALVSGDGAELLLGAVEIMAPELEEQVRQAALSSVFPLPIWVTSKNRSREVASRLIRYLEDDEVREVWLERLLDSCTSLDDLTQQASLLSDLSSLAGGLARWQVWKQKRPISKELRARSNEELHQQVRDTLEHIRIERSESQVMRTMTRLVSPMVNSSAVGKPTAVVLDRIFTTIEAFRHYPQPVQMLLNRFLNRFIEQHPHKHLSKIYKPIPNMILGDQHISALHAQIRDLSQIPDSEARQEAFLSIAYSLEAQGIVPRNVFADYVERAQEIWQGLDKDCAADALEVLKDGSGIESPCPYEMLIPPVLLKRPDLFLELLAVLDNYPYVELEAINYAIAGYFVDGEDRLMLFEKAIDAFSRAQSGEGIVIAWTLAGMARYASIDLVPQILSALSRYPSVLPLIELASRLVDNNEWLGQSFAIACNLGRQEPVHNFICALAPHLDSKGIADAVKVVVDRGIPPSTSRWMLREDQPITSYQCLLRVWMEFPDDAKYDAWNRVLETLSRQPRENLLEHVRWFLPVAVKLGGKRAAVDIARAVVEIGSWQWY